MDSIPSLLGLALRAGRLAVGEEPVGVACRCHKGYLLLLASDAADNTIRRALHFCQAGKTICLTLPLTKQELGSGLGRASCAMLALTDVGFAAAVAEKLAQLAPVRGTSKKVFFANSGAEANEACIKLARRYMRKVKQRDAYEIITLGGCFHGRTFGALAATGRESLSDGFTPLPEGFKQVPANDLAALEAAITPATAAVLVEVVQGEGGIVPLPGDYLRGVEALCRKHDILFICDEVQAGLCRTGTFWAFQQHGLTPDAISMAKSLANGLPMGAMLATDEMAKGFEAGSHATTFGGGALASGVAAKCVEIMLRDKLADRAAELGKHVMDRVRAIQDKLPGTVREVRGLGLMIGIELAVDAAAVWRELIARGFICNLSHGVTLRLLPALTIDKADLDAFIDTLEDILRTAK